MESPENTALVVAPSFNEYDTSLEEMVLSNEVIYLHTQIVNVNFPEANICLLQSHPSKIANMNIVLENCASNDG